MEALKLKTDLQKLGLTDTDTIIVHSSYKALCNKEKIQGGPEAIIKALKDTVKYGTLMLPTLTYDNVNGDNNIFDVINTKSCVGILPEVMRKSHDVFRSVHPTHSIAIWGKDAELIADAHIKDFTPVGPNSPLHELKRRNGKIIMLGCGLKPNTSMHGIEEMAAPDYLFGNICEYKLILHDGTIKMTNNITHNFINTEQRYDRLLDVLDSKDYTFGKVLNADCYVLNAQAVWDKVLEKLKEEPHYFIDKKAD